MNMQYRAKAVPARLAKDQIGMLIRQFMPSKRQLNSMKPRLREYQGQDAEELWKLFYDTVRNINSGDYSAEQMAARAPAEFDLERWQAKMDAIAPFVVESEGQLAGYADIQKSGYIDIDHFFVHHRWQRKGIGSLLMRNIRGIFTE